ncbi:MAG: formate dehydrogenase accessory sulfurtransferase FdhD [Pseudomonadota bacterium]
MTRPASRNELRPLSELVSQSSWTSAGRSEGRRELVAETPVAIVFNGYTVAVMMASPSDLEDFALGFAMSEGFIAGPDDIEEFEEVTHAKGIEARFWLRADRAAEIAERRRAMMGPVGCGLCGIDSLEQALREVAPVTASLFLPAQEIVRASALLQSFQPLQDRTRSAHAAGFLLPGDGIVMAREDVGRHNALDKLLGALTRAGINPASGAVLMTSRVSVELVQKCAVFGCPILIAVSRPTSLAVDTAQRTGITLVGFCRPDGFETYTAADRIVG